MRIILAVIACLFLVGCKGAPVSIKPNFPSVPADIIVCFAKTFPKIEPGAMSKAQIAQLIGRLYASDTKKTFCGRRLIAFYQKVSS